MAQSRILSLTSKQSKLEKDLEEIDKLVYALRKLATNMRRKQFNKSELSRNKLSLKNINALLHSCQTADTIILKIQKHANSCSLLSIFLQQQLLMMAQFDK